MRASNRLGAVLVGLVLIASSSGCERERIAVVPENEHPDADFGRSELMRAVHEFGKATGGPEAYRELARKVEELRPRFSREVAKEAELRLAFLAIRPLQEGLELSPDAQMIQLATTVWPTVLQVPLENGETSSAYVRRLCLTDLALTCKNVVPDYWPILLSAKVWRSMKVRARVAYEECEWCGEDPSFTEILRIYDEQHLKVELMATDAEERGRPRNWPTAGPHAREVSTTTIVSFGSDGWVTIRDKAPPGGDWRKALETLGTRDEPLGLHLAPDRLVADLVELLAEARRTGYKRAALIVREPDFPYDRRQYLLSTARKNYQSFGIRNSDTIQILVQALDHALSKTRPDEAL